MKLHLVSGACHAPKAAARRIGKPESQVRQMIARRTLYSILLDNRRYILVFQFKRRGGLVANITKVNAALRPGKVQLLNLTDTFCVRVRAHR